MSDNNQRAAALAQVAQRVLWTKITNDLMTPKLLDL